MAETTNAPEKKGGFHYAYAIVASCIAITCLPCALSLSCAGIFFTPVSEFFGVPAVFPSDSTVTEVAAGGLERIIDRAFALYRWLPMCGEVREYLKRNDHTVRIGRG